ncbi:MAG: amidase [Acidibrevibacterium sp.]|uniref:amidase n=1 Tax=Acidibrevibacterium sp. TaxID=2606776 RepID=UPI003D008E9F
METLLDLAAGLADGKLTARALVERSLARIGDPAGEGAQTFIKVHAEAARASAEAIDRLRAAGRAPSAFAGIPIALKDLFDIAGEPTPAGSRVLAAAPPAAAHASIVARLIAAGFIPMGRANMTEFAYSGLGLNPHYGTPRSPWQREIGHVPGGSSSGSAVAVADGMAAAAIGTDTGGSCRIPAAFCGITGYKPTARRIPRDGVLPLSETLDSVGPLAPRVACCAILDAIMAGAITAKPPAPLPVSGRRFAIPEGHAMAGLDPAIAHAFERACAVLRDRGARIESRVFPPLEDIPAANRLGGFSAPEAYAWHRQLLAESAALYDPRVAARILRGAEPRAADYVDLLAARARIIAAMDAETADFDALILPTVPIAPPRIADVADDDAYQRLNLQTLRNTSLVNFLDRCAISLPCHSPGEAPAGLMLVGETMADAALFALAAGVEAALAGG